MLCVFPKEPTLFYPAHAYHKERFFDHAVVCLERCLALKETSSAFSALGFCLHLHAMTMPLSRREEANVLLHQAIDTYHQSLAKKPDAAFCTEMLAKALVGALNETDFFHDQWVGRRRRSTTTTSAAAAATRRSRRDVWLSIVNQFVDISWYW